MSDELTELPEGWEWAKLSDVLSILSGEAFKKKDYSSSGVKLLQIANVSFGKVVWEQQNFLPANFLADYPELVLEKNDIVMALNRPILNDLLKIARLSEKDAPAILYQRVARFNLFIKEMRDYFFYYTSSPKFLRLIRTNLQGSDQPYINTSTLPNLPIPLPPLSEQKRIVSKIEELRDRHQAAKQALEAVPKLCDRFRQSVLAAAFRGDLTADWREENYIFDESCQSTTVTEYFSHEIVAPSSWQEFSFQNICKVIGGSQPAKEHFIYEPKEGYIRLIQIRDYKSDQHATYIPIELAKRFCDKNDIMIGRYGPPIFQILRGLEGAYNVALMKAEPDPRKVQAEFLYYFLQNPNLYNYVAAGSLRTAGQDGVRKEHLNTYPVFLPSLSEQEEIVKRIQAYMKAIDAVKDEYQDTQKFLEQLNQSILAKAFRGELVEQDPNDEPASVLLDRIRAEREALQGSKTKKSTKGKQRKTPNKVDEQLEMPGLG